MRPRALEQDEHAAGREQLTHMIQRLPEVPGRVHHVGRHHDVVAPAVEILRRGLALDVQGLAAHELERGERVGRAGGEARRYVGDDVLRTASVERRQHGTGGAAGAGADLEDARATVRRQRRQRPGHHVGDELVVDACDRSIRVDRFRPREHVVREQQRQRIANAAQHVGERAPAVAREAELGGGDPVLLQQLGVQRLRIEHGWCLDDLPSAAGDPEEAVLGEDGQQAPEEPPVTRHDPKALGQRVDRDALADDRCPAQLPERRDDVPGRKRLEGRHDRVVRRHRRRGRQCSEGRLDLRGEHHRRRR